jgi:hypothetical protein
MAKSAGTKKEYGEKKKLTRIFVRDVLIALKGQTVSQMKAADKDKFISSLGILLDVMDETGKVK